jgi:hypothetical protein
LETEDGVLQNRYEEPSFGLDLNLPAERVKVLSGKQCVWLKQRVGSFLVVTILGICFDEHEIRPFPATTISPALIPYNSVS